MQGDGFIAQVVAGLRHDGGDAQLQLMAGDVLLSAYDLPFADLACLTGELLATHAEMPKRAAAGLESCSNTIGFFDAAQHFQPLFPSFCLLTSLRTLF